MGTTIYVFSATGNSLTSARMIAEGLGDCRIVPVASVRKMSKVVDNSETVGFVFPVYYGNMPWPVRELISKMVFNKDAYVFMVATYRGHAGAVAKRMDQLLMTRGIKLSMNLGLPMPGNSFINAPEVDAAHIAAQRGNIDAIVEKLKAREICDSGPTELLNMTPIDYPNNFRGIMADENCTGCGMCAEVCPMENIRLEEGRAVIGDDCATCLACFHWCPVEAVWMSRQQGIERRSKYRHPDVNFDDIASQKA